MVEFFEFFPRVVREIAFFSVTLAKKKKPTFSFIKAEIFCYVCSKET